MAQQACLVFLNERTLWRAVWLALRGHRVCCIPVPTTFAATAGFLSRMVVWLGKYLPIFEVLNFDLRLERYKELRVPRHHDDPYRLAEPWLDRYIGHDYLDLSLHDDAMPVRHAASILFYRYLDAIWFTRWFSMHYDSREAVFVGLDPVVSGAYREIYGTDPSLPSVAPVVPGRFVNVLIHVAALALMLVQALRSVRIAPPACRDVFLGSDYSGNPRDASVWREVAAEGHDVMVVFRTRQQRRARANQISGFPCTVPGEGAWSIVRAWAEWREAWGRTQRIWLVVRDLIPALVLQTCLLPLRRLKIRQMLTRYRFRHFWVRDDYGAEHILRSQELRRVEGKTIGVSHGLPVSCNLVGIWRYIDCDTYMVQGLGILRHYSDRWAPWMKVVASGSLGLTREFEARLSAPRPHDIIFQVKPQEGSEPLLHILDALATAFTDRRIILQVKRFFRDSFLVEQFGQIAKRHANVVATDESIYELFLRARYLITDPSTIAVEAIQFGLYAFVMDCDGRRSLYFRDFPEFCENSPDELAHRIRGIEDGSYRYRFADYDGLINRQGHFFNQFRAELGLPPIVSQPSQTASMQLCAE
jgi:hypothetical protein